MTLATGTGLTAIRREIYAYNGVDFSSGSTGDEQVVLDFTSPNDHYRCELNVSLDTGSWAPADIIAIIFRANGLTIFKAKWAVNATTIGSPQAIYPLAIILPPQTRFKAILIFSSTAAMVGTGNVVLVGRAIG